jgi:hypothetical protein
MAEKRPTMPVDRLRETAARQYGNSSHAAIRRLRKDRPDLYARVMAGELSPHAAAVAAGFRRKVISVPLDPERAAAALKRHFSPEERAVIAAAITQPDEP